MLHRGHDVITCHQNTRQGTTSLSGKDVYADDNRIFRTLVLSPMGDAFSTGTTFSRFHLFSAPVLGMDCYRALQDVHPEACVAQSAEGEHTHGSL
jgi:hypothetical protein